MLRDVSQGGRQRVTHYCDVYMDDKGFYRAGCAMPKCSWESGQCLREHEAERAADRHHAAFHPHEVVPSEGDGA